MTQTSVFGQDSESEKKKSPIEFEKTVYTNGNVESTSSDPKYWGNLILLRKGDNADIMYAYDNGKENYGRIYLGRWNDGVVV